MAEPEGRAQEPGNGSPENGEPGSGLFARLRQRVALSPEVLDDVSKASMLIFLLASFAIIFVLIVYTPTPVPSVEVLRSTQLLLTLAGTAVILGLLTKDLNAFTVAFGFLVIAALIVPTKDIIRFALIASGSEQRYADFFPENQGSTEFDRTDDTAARIYSALHRLEERGTVIRMESGALARQSIVAEISKALRAARDRESYARILQKGATETLKALARGEGDEWIYRYGDSDEFRSNVDYLRFEGVVTTEYGDVSSLKITSRGCRLLWALDPPRLADASGYMECPRSSVDTVNVGEAPYSASLSLAIDGILLPFTVTHAGMYEVCAVPQTTTTDPALRLLGPDESVLAVNDDFDFARDLFGSRIAQPLRAGTDYYLEIKEVFGDPDGAVLLLIAKQDTSSIGQPICSGYELSADSAAELAKQGDKPPAEESPVDDTSDAADQAPASDGGMEDDNPPADEPT